MHNAYFSSNLLSLKTKGPLSFSFNDYSNLLNERFDRIPSSRCCSCCCSCCELAAAHNRVPINPSYLYGLRQSTLIQRSSYKRLVFGGLDLVFSRFPVYDLDRGSSYEVTCSIRKRNADRGIGRRRKGRFRCTVSEEKSERNWLGGVDDAEAVISLLSEEVSEKYLGGRERNQRLAKRVEVKKSEDSGHEFCRGTKNKVEVEKRGSYAGECSRGRKKNVGSNLLESELKCEFKSVGVESREEGYGRNEWKEAIARRENRREAIARGENHKERTRNSSCSSCYSFSSAEEYGSEEEVQEKEEQFAEQSFSGFRMDSSRSEEDGYKTQVVEEFNRHENGLDGYGEFLQQRSTTAGSHVEWDCKNKSEKKLTEVAVEETKSGKQSSKIHLRLDRIGEIDCGKASTSHKQFSDTEKRSIINLDMGTRKVNSKMGIQDTKRSRSKWKQVTELEGTHGSGVETTSESQKLFSRREENLMRDGHYQTVGLSAGNNHLRRNSQQLNGTSEILNVDNKRVSDMQRHLESGMKVQQEDETLVQSSVQQTKGQKQQRSETFTGQIDLTREPEYLSEFPETHDTNVKKISTIQSETRIKNQEENSRLVYPEAKAQHSQRDHKHYQRSQSQKGSQDVTRVSVVRSDMETHSESQRTSEKTVINQESTLKSVVTPIREKRERYNQSDEKVMQIKLRRESQKPTRLSSSHDESLNERSSVQVSVNLASQATVQQINVEEEKEEDRISQAHLMSPSSQLIARSSLHVSPTGGVAFQEVSNNTSESGSSAFYTQSEWRSPDLHKESYVRDRPGERYDKPLNLPTPDDAMGSAHRLEELSMQIVGEFVEKASHEVSTSEMQKENIAETNVVYEGEKQLKKNLGQDGSEDFQLKGHETRRSSKGSGTKGPSDEMWDVKDSFVQPSDAEAPESNQAAGNAIVKRKGRSLWNIIASIVRLQWDSHAETSNSAARSDARSLSNESRSSETWFSGRESDKNSNENMRREGISMQQDGTPFHQLQRVKSLTHTQGETFDVMRLKNKEIKLEVDMSSSTNIIEGGSTSKRISSNLGVKNLDQKTDRNSSQSTVSGMEVVPAALQLPAGSTRPPAVEAISETVKTCASGSGSMGQLAQPFSSSLTKVSGSAGKDGELKQRKLQPNKQVLKDRFDEWEEAYKLESEQQNIDEMFMREALLEAKKAADTWEVPVGAVLVQSGKIIARGCNLVEEMRDSTAHAEMICIREASNVLQSWRLADTTLYVTVEPCPMCAGAILQARISTLVWGAPNKLLGADGSWVRLFPDGGEVRDGLEPSDKPAALIHPFHPKMTIRRGVLQAECADVMQQFFQLRRRKKNKNADTQPPPSCLPIANQPSKFLTKMQHMFHIMFCS